MGDQPVARTLPTHTTAQTQIKCRETHMYRLGFESTTSMHEQEKTNFISCILLCLNTFTVLYQSQHNNFLQDYTISILCDFNH
jgi:hypothetical protein